MTTAKEAIQYIRKNRKDYEATDEQYTFSVDIHTMISDTPLNVLSRHEVELLLANNF